MTLPKRSPDASLEVVVALLQKSLEHHEEKLTEVRDAIKELAAISRQQVELQLTLGDYQDWRKGIDTEIRRWMLLRTVLTWALTIGVPAAIALFIYYAGK